MQKRELLDSWTSGLLWVSWHDRWPYGTEPEQDTDGPGFQGNGELLISTGTNIRSQAMLDVEPLLCYIGPWKLHDKLSEAKHCRINSEKTFMDIQLLLFISQEYKILIYVLSHTRTSGMKSSHIYSSEWY